MSGMDERFRALADFMEWVDPEGYAEVLADEPCGCDVHPRWCAWNGPCCDNCSHGHEEAHAECCGVTFPPGETP